MCVCPCVAPVEKLFRLVIIKEVKGSQVAAQLQSSVRDKLSYADKYEDEEEEEDVEDNEAVAEDEEEDDEEGKVRLSLR